MFSAVGMPVNSVSVIVNVVDVDADGTPEGGMPEDVTPESVLSLSLLSLFEASISSGEVVCFWAATLVAEGALLGRCVILFLFLEFAVGLSLKPSFSDT